MSPFAYYLNSFQRNRNSLTRALQVHLGLWLFLYLFIILSYYLLAHYYNFKMFPKEKIVDRQRYIQVRPKKDMKDTEDNINEDKKRKITKITRLYKKDSKGKGALTKKKGLSAPLAFNKFWIWSGSVAKLKKRASSETMVSNEMGKIKMSFFKNIYPKKTIKFKDKGKDNENLANIQSTKFMVPFLYNKKRAFRVNISNDNEFSLSTLKIPKKLFEYFQKLKKKLAYNVNRNLPSLGMYLGDFNHYYFPGLNRVISFKPGRTRIAFLLNKNGKIIKTQIIESHSSSIITDSFHRGIIESKEFGPLPKSINAEYLVIEYRFHLR